MKSLIAFIAGTIFSIGLVTSGMTNPKKVIGFLDVFGNWDYSLAFVMVGAIAVSFITFRFINTDDKPFFAAKYFLPGKSDITKSLIIGSALFGIGWGIVGLCPGPGIVNLATNNSSAFLFVGSMIFGMMTFKTTERFFK